MSTENTSGAANARKERLAVLGGGMSSLVTVFELTSLPDWKDRFESITVYQQGWRLGGKGASGRNDAMHDRNEEHGLHLLFGAYENVFRIMRECYSSMPEGRERDFDNAVEGHGGTITMFERHRNRWVEWELHLPPRPSRPGDGKSLALHPSTNAQQLSSWAYDWGRNYPPALEPLTPDASGERETPASWLEATQRLARSLTYNTETAELQSKDTAIIADMLEYLDRYIAWAKETGRGDIEILDSEGTRPTFRDHARRWLVLSALGAVILKGLLRDRVIWPRERWFCIDDLDLRDWLAQHGAWSEVFDSAPVCALYDGVFTPPTYGAGTALHVLMLASRYKGCVLYRMKAGMGETIFAPLYRVLKDRGVRFEFFHRIDKLVLSSDRRRIEEIQFERQAEPKADQYDPLVEAGPDGRKIACFPTEPVRDRLKGTGKLPNFEDWWEDSQGTPGSLKVGKDFDRVVLGISIGAFEHICSELVADPSNRKFGEMVRAVKTTPTQAFQLWLNKQLIDLDHRAAQQVVIPFAEPFDTWADMTLVNDTEKFPARMVEGLTYHCSSLDDPDGIPARPNPGFSATQKERVYDNAIRWLENHIGTIWNFALPGRGMDWNVLVDEQNRKGRERFRAQYWCAVHHPSDRYVWAVAGSVSKRLRAGESGYSNLVLAGDWTLNGASVGCLEAAAMSGIHAARVLDPRVPRPANEWLPDEGPACPPFAAPAIAAVQPRIGSQVPRPKYVKRDGELLAWPPIDVEIDMHVFVLKACGDRLRELCENQINVGPTKYTPIGNFVVLYCADMNNIVSEGSIRELDVGIWIPVRARRSFPPRLLTFTPYAWVSNSSALVGGRTMYGFPKHVANIGMPEVSRDHSPFSVDTVVGINKGDAGQQLRLLDIRRHPRAVSAEVDERISWRDPLDVVAAQANVLERLLSTGGPFVGWTSLQRLFHAQVGMPMVFLKQFPMLEEPVFGDTGHACYQAIIEASIDVTDGFNGGPLSPNYDVSFLRCYSHQIVETLGLKGFTACTDSAGRRYEVGQPLTAGWMRFKGVVRKADRIWEA